MRIVLTCNEGAANLWAIFAVALAIGAAVGCASEEGASDGEDTRPEVDVADGEVQEDVEIEMGNECEIDEDCNDHVDCTVDSCSNGTCFNTPDDEYCDDGLECNGMEVCNAEDGCLPGEIFRGCDDGNPCTMDICVEGPPGEAPHCESQPLDRDRDGHLDIHCEGGDDCNDLSDRVYPGAREFCFDNLDNDCDGKVDFNDEECTLSNDTCATPRDLAVGTMDEGFTFGAAGDIDSSCDVSSWPDVAFSFTLDAPSDVRLAVTGRDDFNPVYVALQTECGVYGSTLYCGSGQPFMYCEKGMEAGTYYLVVSSWVEGAFDIRLDAEEPGPPPEGDSCSNAIRITGDGHWEGDLLCMEDDLAFQCISWAHYKDMVFTFSLDEMQDVLVRASAILFAPYVTLYGECSSPSPAIVCDSGYPFERRATRLEPGNYTIGVESYTPGEFALDVSFLPPSAPPENETCADAVDVSTGGTFPGSLLAAADDYDSTCTWACLDVFYTFTLAETKDVHLAARGIGTFDPYLVLMRECGNPSSEIWCHSLAPADLYLRSLPAGDYWIAVEAPYGGEFNLDVAFLPPTSACDGITVIDTSTSISDTTTGRPDDFESTCGGYARSPDRPYLLRLAAASDVTAEITAAPFDTVLHMRTACEDPSSQVVCDDDGAGFPLSRFHLAALAAGDYILIVDGYGSGSYGDYTLAVTITPL
jgi:hypothetical protein